MIDITVKTLDLKNHQFSVSEELTVKEFKDVVSHTVHIPVEEQRLIFRGRILQDDKKLLEYNLGNNTVHLVQRPHRSEESNQNDAPAARNTTTAGGEQIAGANIPIGIPTRSRNSAAVRLQIANDMMSRASNLLQRLEEDDEIAAATQATSDASSIPVEENQEQMEIIATDDPNSLGHVMSQVANAANAASATAVFVSVHTIHSGEGDDDDDVPTIGRQNTAAGMRAGSAESVPSNLSAPTTQHSPRLREMAIVLQDLMAFHDRLTPFLQFVQRILRENSLFSTDTGELQSMQYVYDTVTAIVHYLGHAYHAFSDLLCDFSILPQNRHLSLSAQGVDQSVPINVVPMSFGATGLQQQPGTQSTAPIPTPNSQSVPMSQTQPIVITGGLNVNSQIQNVISASANPNGSENVAAGNANNPFANLQQTIRNHMMRPSFDMLLPCQSHHINQNRARERPADLHQHVNASQAVTTGVSEGTLEFIEALIDLIRRSSLMETLQPYCKDFVQNYLMRGRDSTNSQHIKSCARGLAKKLIPFFQRLKNKIVIKNENIAYEDTITEFLSDFYFMALSLVLSPGPIAGFRTSILFFWQDYMFRLFAIFRHCFPNTNRVPEIFASLIVDTFLVGMPIVFQKSVKSSLVRHFEEFSLDSERIVDAQSLGVKFVYKPDDDLIDDDISASVSSNMAKLSTKQSLGSTMTESLTPETTNVPTSLLKKEVAFAGDSTMETDIDDLIASPIPYSSEAAMTDFPLRHIPAEWRATVQHDINRQMGMPDPLPPTRGFHALFPRRD